jgi:hypothetical protein
MSFAIAIVLILLSLPAAAQQGLNRNDFRVIAPHDWTLLPAGKTNERRFVSPRRDAWLSLYASNVRGPVSSHFHRWGVRAGDRVTYQRQGQGWNVVSNRIFYRKTMLACGGQQWHNLEFEYSASDKPAMDGFVTRASYALGAYRTVGLRIDVTYSNHSLSCAGRCGLICDEASVIGRCAHHSSWKATPA